MKKRGKGSALPTGPTREGIVTKERLVALSIVVVREAREPVSEKTISLVAKLLGDMYECGKCAGISRALRATSGRS